MNLRASPFLVAGLLSIVAGCGNVAGPTKVSQPTVQGQSMQAMLADIDQVRAYVYGGGGQSDAEHAANDLVSWSARLADLFPPAQASVDYVDMSPDRARGAPAAMRKVSDSLLATVRTGNRAATGDQLARVEKDGCGFCHLSSTR